VAGDWIKIEHVTPDKPEVHRMAEALGIDPDAVVGKLLRLWIWADQQTYFGDALSVTLSSLDRICFVTGFAQALVNVGWLTCENGLVRFTNFDRHNGNTAKTRAGTMKRMQRKRDADSVTKPSPEKRKRRDNTPLPPLPFSSDEFRYAWEEWEKHRSEIGKKLKPTTIKKQFKELAAMGEARAIAALGNSVKNGYMGIFESKSKAPEVNSDYERIKLHQMSGEDEDE